VDESSVVARNPPPVVAKSARRLNLASVSLFNSITPFLAVSGIASHREDQFSVPDQLYEGCGR
jgi:hypothetical protein